MQQACHAIVQTQAEVPEGDFSLADLLAPGTCPELLRAASRVHLGSVPLAGSVRVLDDSDVRARLTDLALRSEIAAIPPASLTIPQRIVVRRAGARASCGDLLERIRGECPAEARASWPANALPSADCGVGGRIPLGAPLELIRTTWDVKLESWEISARCVRAQDCVPFVVRVPGRDLTPAGIHPTHLDTGTLSSAAIALPHADATSIGAEDGKPLVRPGEAVSLLWDQDGIRLVVPAICLDRGVLGGEVRARIGRGGRVVRAIVLGARRLQARF